MAKADLTADHLREILNYNQDTGVFTWKKLPIDHRQLIGKTAGSKDYRGYISISINRSSYYCHRLAYFWINGEWPAGAIDHMDGDKSNNAINNLRVVTSSQNSENRRKASIKSKSGVLGVHKHRKKWRATITVNGVWRHIGDFVSIEDAANAYINEKRNSHEACTI